MYRPFILPEFGDAKTALHEGRMLLNRSEVMSVTFDINFGKLAIDLINAIRRMRMIEKAIEMIVTNVDKFI